MAVTIYRSTDAGAPALPANVAYNSAKFYMDVIKACLVTGYGSKAGAGWTIDYEDTTAGKHRLAVSNGNGIAEFITWGSYSVAMLVWDSISTPGVGRLNTDTYSAVMSAGVNGWLSERVPAPGVSTSNITGLYTGYYSSSYTSNIAWTVFADDKSAWVLFHYPSAHASASASSPLGMQNYHSQIFMGAIKSPDLEREQEGNFFLLGGTIIAANTANVTFTSQYLTPKWGLRTPTATLPQAANTSKFELQEWSCSIYTVNAYSSVRVTNPVLLTYHGTDVPKPAGQSLTNAQYAFAVIPGLAQFSAGGTGSTYDFWTHVNIERSASWNMADYTIGGVNWMPWFISNNGGSFALTSDAGWW